MRRAGSLICKPLKNISFLLAVRSQWIAMAFQRRSLARLASHPCIRIELGEIAGLPPADWASVIVATGP